MEREARQSADVGVIANQTSAGALIFKRKLLLPKNDLLHLGSINRVLRVLHEALRLLVTVGGGEPSHNGTGPLWVFAFRRQKAFTGAHAPKIFGSAAGHLRELRDLAVDAVGVFGHLGDVARDCIEVRPLALLGRRFHRAGPAKPRVFGGFEEQPVQQGGLPMRRARRALRFVVVAQVGRHARRVHHDVDVRHPALVRLDDANPALLAPLQP